jgi:hypothetical protein
MDQVFRFAGLEPNHCTVDIDIDSNPRYFATWEQIRSQNETAMTRLIDRHSPAVESHGYSLREPMRILTSHA